MCEQVFKTYSGGVCDEAVALGHEERFGKVLDVYEKCLTNRKVRNPTIIEIIYISNYKCECDMVNDSYLSCYSMLFSYRGFSFEFCLV